MNLKRLLQFAAWPTAAGVIIALLAMLVFPQLRGQQPNHATPNTSENYGPVSYADAVARAAPAVVNIYTAKKVLQQDPRYYNNPYFRQLYNNSNIPLQERMQRTLGSGVIMDAGGLILTNNHVINSADKIQVLLNDGRYTSAELVGIDNENDLAVLKIALDNLTPISLGQPNNLRVGDVVLAIGNPFGVGQSVSQGIVSAMGRWGLGINTSENFIQTDAAVNPGNSGGALIDARGNLIGINTAILDETNAASVGISFAVPADTAMNSLKQIVQYGEVRHIWLGFSVIPKYGDSPTTLQKSVLVVTNVEPGSPVSAAGLVEGDIVTHINGLNVIDIPTAKRIIAGIEIGSEIKIGILRGNKTIELSLKAQLPPRNRTKT
ncbi:MAG: trypsin-like serine protease [Gammaproteobacteria bacterium]|nr:MAG: trypsin-like serine protease [Gammaproteobacteria bacterium]